MGSALEGLSLGQGSLLFLLCLTLDVMGLPKPPDGEPRECSFAGLSKLPFQEQYNVTMGTQN